MKRRILFLCVVLILVLSTILSACAKPAPAPAPAPAPKPEPIVLKAVQADYVGHPLFVGWDWYVKEVNSSAKGELIIDVIGGPEAMPLKDQGDAVAAGVVDIACNYGSWLEKLLPEMAMWHARRIGPDEMRKRGAYELLQKETNKLGVYWLGPTRELLDSAHWISVNKWVDKPQDLAGLRIATFAGLAPWIEGLGMTPVIMPPPERYAAIERGIADGAAHSLEGQFAFAYHELPGHDYWIDYGAFSSGEMMIMNLEKFNSLPEHLQKLLIDVQLELEAVSEALSWKEQAKVKQGMIDGGMRPITFSPEDAKWYVDLAYEAEWEKMREKYPELAPKIFELWGQRL